MKLYIVLFVVLVVVSAQVFGNGDKVLDSYYGQIEPECARAGGRCILKSQCEPEHLASKSGLCPKQRSHGFECCHGAPKDENRCTKFGGECFEKNYCKNPHKRATDCGPDKDCCILV